MRDHRPRDAGLAIPANRTVRRGGPCRCTHHPIGVRSVWSSRWRFTSTLESFIDPHTGQALPDGQFGEPVFPTLTKQALPVIRYRTGDLTRLLPGTARTMRRIQKITGRSDDMIILRGVNIFPTQIEELLLQQPALAPHFQCVLGRQGPLDTLTVTAEPASGVAVDVCAAAARQLAERVKNSIGVTVAVRLVPAGSIERSTGKMRRIVDTRSSLRTRVSASSVDASGT